MRYCVERKIAATSFLLLILSCFPCVMDVNAEDEFIHNILHYPPYWEKVNGHIEGIHARLARRLYQEARLDVKFRLMPYARVLHDMNNPETAFMAYGENKATDQLLLFPIPMTPIILRNYSLTPNPPTDFESLKEGHIVIKRGFPLGSYQAILNNVDFKVTMLNSVKQSINFMVSGRADYLITLNHPFERAITKIPQLKPIPIYSSDLHYLKGYPIVIPKIHPRSRELHNRVKAAYEKLYAEGVVGFKNGAMMLTSDF